MKATVVQAYPIECCRIHDVTAFWFFEVFATVVIAYLCSELGFLKKSSALRATYLTTILYLGSGVVGTLHHLYFSGAPVFIAAIGSVFSALEVIPLTLVGFEVLQTLKLSREAEGFYRWPLRFLLRPISGI